MGKGIPNFWFQALSNFHSTAEYIQPEDFEDLEALKDIRCELNETYTGFSIILSFEENEYFTNLELRKDYVVSPDLLEENYPSLESATGTEIDWKSDKNLCEKTIQKRQKAKSGKRKGETRVISTKEEVPSFFHFFRDPREPEDEDDEDDDEENRNPHLDAEEDYEIAHSIRTMLLPDAVGWYTGEFDDDYEGEDEEDEDEEGDEDDEDEDAAPQLVRNKGKKSSMQPAKGASSIAGEKPPECKQ